MWTKAEDVPKVDADAILQRWDQTEPSLQRMIVLQCFLDLEAMKKFKAYVHKRLDDAGVPADPDSPHKAEGCRIGGRLDVALKTTTGGRTLQDAVNEADRLLEKMFDDADPDDGWLITRITKIREALADRPTPPPPGV